MMTVQINIFNHTDEFEFLHKHDIAYLYLSFCADNREKYKTIEIDEADFAYMLLHGWKKSHFVEMQFDTLRTVEYYRLDTHRTIFDPWGFYSY